MMRTPSTLRRTSPRRDLLLPALFFTLGPLALVFFAGAARAQVAAANIGKAPPPVLSAAPIASVSPPLKEPDAKPAASASSSNGDTGTLSQFKDEIEFEPKPPGYKVQFSLEDAELPELVKVMGQLTGRRFVIGAKVRPIKATIYSPQKVTVAEAYQAFLSVLETNGLTVIPSGKFLKIVETPGIVNTTTTIYGPGKATPLEDRYVTRLHRLTYVTADEVANVLTHFKSKDADVAIYSPGNLLVITDTGTNIARMMTIVEEIDVAGVGDQLWYEPLHYANAAEIAAKLSEIFDVGKSATPTPAVKGPGSQAVESRVTKVVSDERTNSVIVIGTEKAYLRIVDVLKMLDVPLSGEGQVHVLPLQHADAEELAKTMSDIASKAGTAAAPGAPAKGGAGVGTATVFESPIRITADKSTNSLVITSSLRDYASLRGVIDKLDQARRQVFLEAVIMEVSTNHTDSLNIGFHGGAPDGQLDSLIYGGSNAAMTATTSIDPSILQGMALGVRSNSVLSLAGLSIPAFGLAIQALASSVDSNVISTPHLMATDNVPAEMNVGEEISVSTGSSASSLGTGAATGAFGAFPSLVTPVSRQKVGTRIKLLPHINDSNEVRLEIDEEINEQGSVGAGTLTPTVIIRTAKTQVVVQDGQTVVIGGLVRDVQKSEEYKVPILGDIPLIGMLFKKSTKANQKRNLLLILTPYVVRDPADLRAIFERKTQERQEFIDRYFVFAGKPGTWEPMVDYSRTHGLLEEIRQVQAKADEQADLDEAAKEKDVLTHEAGKPVGEMVGKVGPAAAYAPGGAPGPAPVPVPVPALAPVGGPPTGLKPGGAVLKSVKIEN